MIVICEECGKKYRIDPSKIKGDKARFKCKACNHVITASKPEIAPSDLIFDIDTTPSTPNRNPQEDFAPVPARQETKAPEAKKTGFGFQRKGIGLRAKMIALFFIIPIIIIIIAGILFVWQLNSLSSELIKRAGGVAAKMAEEKIAHDARSIANQCRLYLENHPELTKEDFIKNSEFKNISVQKIGLTGYSALYEIPGADGIWRTWTHVKPNIIGIDMSTLAKNMGRNFPGFWKIYTGVKGGKEASGYYRWQDADKKFRDKYMTSVPIEGTRYVIAATTYIDEFTKHQRKLDKDAAVLSNNTRNISFGILAGTLLIIGVVVSFYGHTLTGRIKSLTDVADRISVGELDVEIDIKTNDEIGELGEAISRMQDSIRLSIERLRRRR